ncbi:MAG: 50S ribosomal protein L25 [Parcubacteria group bacterium]|nr:50S ribosomal protein L25 [Parcubacteria group bacterium]
MEKIELQAEIRESVGKSLNSLRKEGFLPSVVYGRNFKPIAIQTKYKDFEKIFKKAGESTLINLKIGDKEEPTVIKDIQKDPVSDQIIHADFYKVNLSEKIKANIPVVVKGESEAVKAGGILVKTVNELEVEALPQDLPHELEIDISRLQNFGDHIQIKDISVSDRVKIEANPEDIVALIQEPREEVIEEAAPSIEEVEVIKKEPSVGEGVEEGKEEKKEKVIDKSSEEQK